MVRQILPLSQLSFLNVGHKYEPQQCEVAVRALYFRLCQSGGCSGCMVVGFTITYAISA